MNLKDREELEALVKEHTHAPYWNQVKTLNAINTWVDAHTDKVVTTTLNGVKA